MHLAPLIQDLAVIMGVAALVTVICRRIRQPVVLGYIMAGFIIGPHTPPYSLVRDLPNIHVLAELGVIFLMFNLGLEFSFRKLARVGASASVTACVEIGFMLTLGYFAGKAFGWSSMDSVFLGAILSISSTTIIIKALDELGLKKRRFAELIFGILIVEDLFAILILVAITTIVSSGTISGAVLALAAGKLALVVGAWVLTGYFIVPRIVQYVARFQSDEMLTVLSLGLCLTLVTVAAAFHYSAALGAFIMGSILAESSELKRIEELMMPLRDIFAAIFFVSVGMLMDPVAIWEYKWLVLSITGITILGKVVSTSLGALISGQRLHTSLQVGFGLSQIGEFSFIIAGLGLSLKAMSPHLYPIAVAVSLVTTFTTPYLIRISERAVTWTDHFLPERVIRAMDNYVVFRERRAAIHARSPEFNARILRWILSGFVMTLLAAMSSTLAVPWIEKYLPVPLSESGSIIAGWILALLGSSPFVWGMFSAFRNFSQPLKRHGESLKNVSVRGIFNVLTILWLAIVSLLLFPSKYIVVVASIASVVLFKGLFRTLEVTYGWFEEGFLAGFRQNEEHTQNNLYRRLAPWDGHLVQIRIHPNSELAGKRIMEAALRNKHGLNVVAIQRGSKTIVAPKPDQILFPQDLLLVLGTDFQIESVRETIESPNHPEISENSIADYQLEQIFIAPNSLLIGRSIRQSGIRENYSGMVVGIERDSKRIMNPDSDLHIKEGDILWLVGEPGQIARLAKVTV